MAFDSFRINCRGSSKLLNGLCLIARHICMLGGHPSAGFVADIEPYPTKNKFDNKVPTHTERIVGEK